MDFLFLALSFTAGCGCMWLVQQWSIRGYRRLASQIIERAELEGEMAKKEKEISFQKWEIEQKHASEEKQKKELRKLQEKEEKLNQKSIEIDKRNQELHKVVKERKEIAEKEKVLDRLLMKKESELKQISELTFEEARKKVIENVTLELETDRAKLIDQVQKETLQEANRIASTVIATAINRLSIPTVSEVTTTTVTLPNEEMKRRIIGRDGRNIRSLESLTGVTLLIDDTPGAVVISGFDPIRRQIAKSALSELMIDGRIHPTRIEESVEKAKEDTEELIRAHGQNAASILGIVDLHPKLIQIVGKLKFRYSYGQNVWEHSLEVAHLMGIMAEELSLDVDKAKRIGLLHDMGKVATHEYKGTHALIGHDLALKYGETQSVANGIGCHHEEIEPTSAESWLCIAADKISAARPGARVEAVEGYVNRLKNLEKIALEFSAVESAFALQAGREVRIAVLPEKVSDEELQNLTREIAKKIEKELKFPGKIKVTAIREKRSVAYAI